MKKNPKGFTLIELLVVVAIIGILAAVAVPKLLSAIERAKYSAAQGDIASFNTALSLYQVAVKINVFPTNSLLQLLTDNSPGWEGPYMAGQTIQMDPWGGNYTYTPYTSNLNYTIQTGEGVPKQGYSTTAGMYTIN